MKVVFGGTFDPVHIGHLRMANALAESLSVKEVFMMPCYDAVHKHDVGASSECRKDMLALAAKNDTLVSLDDRESRRGKSSYTIESLLELRAELGEESLCFVMGTDAANGFSSWFRVNEFSKLTHVVVVNRVEARCDSIDQAAVAAKLESLGFSLSRSLNELKTEPAGKFIFLDLPLLEISSTDIRERIKQGLTIRYLVTDEVRGYICDNALYQN